MTQQERFAGKSIPTSPFAGDDGRADPELVTVLAAVAAGQASKYSVVDALRPARLFVPVVALLDSEDVTDDGHRTEKDSHMATVSMTGTDGRQAMLAFTAADWLGQWSTEARPVPAQARTVAAAALAEGSDVLLLDLGTAHTLVLERPGVLALAEDRQWLPPSQDPELLVALHTALAEISAQFGCQFVICAPTGSADLRIVAEPRPGSASADPVAALQAASGRLAEVELLRLRLAGGLELGLS
jgi:hypothetical protein